MKKYILILLIYTACSAVFAKPQQYTLESGGGIDDTALGLKDGKGKKFWVYCQEKCGPWFIYDEQEQHESLSPHYKGRKVIAELSLENNKDRIAGPGEDEKLYFIKTIKLLK